MTYHSLVLGALAVWRITHLATAEDGPFDVVAGLRRRAGAGFFGKLLDCFYCMSVWVAAPLSWALGGSLEDRLLLWPALSGAAILLERVTEGRTATQAATYYEEQEHDDVMLRKQETGGPGRDPVFHEE